MQRGEMHKTFEQETLNFQDFTEPGFKVENPRGEVNVRIVLTLAKAINLHLALIN